MALAGVDDHDSRRAGGRDQRRQRGHHFEQLIDVVAQALAETAGQQEISLHVDDDQRRLALDDTEWSRFGGDFDDRAHMCSSAVFGKAEFAVTSGWVSRGSSRIRAASASAVSSVSAAPSNIAL